MILAALAAAAGLARGISGIVGAHKQGVQDRTLIKRAYQTSHRRLGESQSYTRQGVNESLNARGILNGGANTATSPVLADAQKQGAQAKTDAAGITTALAKGKATDIITGKAGNGSTNASRGYSSEQASLAADSERNQTGDASTLSGQTNSDLSREFYGEQQDLASQRDQGLTASQRAQSAATVGAIGAGIDVGTQVYQAGSLIQGALGSSQAAIPGTPAAATQPQPVKPGNWFGGYDPVDPLGLSKRKISNDQFNVNTKD